MAVSGAGGVSGAVVVADGLGLRVEVTVVVGRGVGDACVAVGLARVVREAWLEV